MKCSRLKIELYTAGELCDAERLEVESHLDDCSDCSSYAALLKVESTEFLRSHQFSSFAHEHARTAELSWYGLFVNTLLKPSFVPVFVAVLLLAVVPLHIARENVRFKGGYVLSYVYERNGVVSHGAPDVCFSDGDRIQVSYNLESSKYVALVSMDSRGTVSFYNPDTGAQICSVRSGPGKAIAFPGSIVLDSTPGAELVVALFSDSAISTVDVVSWLRWQFETTSDPVELYRMLRVDNAPFKADVATLLLRKE